MKLENIRIRNFRCFQSEISISFEDITALIGRNDAGKSTILEALDIFLNEETPDKFDGSVKGDKKDITLICEFSDIPEEVVIDEDNPTKLETEYLLNTKGNLEIHKTFDGSLQNPKLKSISIFAEHPSSDNVKDLIQLKNSDLKKRAKELKIDLNNVDQTVNAQLRKCIRQNEKDLKTNSVFVPLNENNGAKVWMGLKQYLPIYALFKSDRESTDQDPEAQDPMKVAIKEALKQKEKELNIISDYVKDEVNKIAGATLDKLKEMDSSLSNELKAEITTKKFDTLFGATIKSDDGIPINKRGSGIKRLILLNFFRAKAEQKMQDEKKPDVIYAFEEPETSQHPNNQILLMNAFNALTTKAQIIISTHTPILARMLNQKCLRYINVNEDNTREIIFSSDENIKKIIKSIGILPDNNVKLFIGVEGRNDISFLKNISKLLFHESIIKYDLETLEINGEIIFFPLGGSNLALWTSRLQNLNRPEFHLFDRDTIPPAKPKYFSEINEINKRENCKAICTNKRELENYIHKDAITKVYINNSIDLQLNNNFEDFDDVPDEIAKKVHQKKSKKDWEADLNDKERSKKISNVKKLLNNEAIKLVTLNMLREIDKDNEILNWFKIMSELMEKS